MTRIHLITTCSRRKSVPAGDNIFPSSAASLPAALDLWRKQISVASTGADLLTTNSLYHSDHWRRAQRIADTSPRIELWVISAGLGLRHACDPAVPYEATFHDIPYPPQDVWARLTQVPPLPGRCASLTDVMRCHPEDTFVVAGSPIYISAVENDIQAGLSALSRPEQVMIVTSKGYNGTLLSYVQYSHAGMLSELHTNMTCLNIAYAGILVGQLLKGE